MNTRKITFWISALGILCFAERGVGLSFSSPDWMAEGHLEEAYFGGSVATAGDVNGDGYADLIVGAYYYTHGEPYEGSAFVYHGAANGLSRGPNWRAEGNEPSAYFGGSVATAGDVNGDGYSDVIVGAYYHGDGRGKAYVYHGSATGLSLAPDWTVEGAGQGDSFLGRSVGAAGDVNGDGYDDVIVGAYYASNGEFAEGQAYLYYGSPTGLSRTPAWIGEGNQGDYAFFGYAVATAGDVNGDAYSDIIIGAFGYDDGETDEGAAFVYHGSPSGLGSSADWMAESNQANAYFGAAVASAGDVNGDGYADVIVGALHYSNGETEEGRAYVYYGSASGLSPSADWMAEGDQEDGYFGASVRTAGDFNGDGYDDVIVGAYEYSRGQLEEGLAALFLGSASGLSVTAQRRFQSNQPYARSGYSVAAAGDVNNDGYSDIVIGAPYYDNSRANEGIAVVYHGR